MRKRRTSRTRSGDKKKSNSKDKKKYRKKTSRSKSRDKKKSDKKKSKNRKANRKNQKKRVPKNSYWGRSRRQRNGYVSPFLDPLRSPLASARMESYIKH